MRLSTPYGTVTVLFNDAVAGRIAGSRGACVLRKDEIRVAGASISAKALAHEMKHVLRARELGWRYLPTMGLNYVVAFGYANSREERNADAWAEVHWMEFTDLFARYRIDGL